MSNLLGLGAFLKNMNALIGVVENRTLKGMVKATIIVRRDMDKASPLIPVDTGNLRASWFVVTSKGGTPRGSSPNFKGDRAGNLSSGHSESVARNKSIVTASSGAAVIMGFSANYAFFVHEMLGVSDIRVSKKKQISPLSQAQRRSFGFARFKRPGSGAKFFEASIKRNAGKIIDVIAKETEFKKAEVLRLV